MAVSEVRTGDNMGQSAGDGGSSNAVNDYYDIFRQRTLMEDVVHDILEAGR